MTLVLAVTILFGSYAHPAYKSLLEVTSIEVNDQRFKVTFTEAMGKVQISIYNSKGKIIERNHFHFKLPTTVPYNLDQLPEGVYKIKVSSKEEEVNFEVNSKKAVERKLLAYGNRLDKNTIQLRVVGLEKPGVTVDIYNKTGKKISTDKIDQAGGFSKNYKIKYLEAKEVYFKVSDADGRIKYLHFD